MGIVGAPVELARDDPASRLDERGHCELQNRVRVVRSHRHQRGVPRILPGGIFPPGLPADKAGIPLAPVNVVLKKETYPTCLIRRTGLTGPTRFTGLFNQECNHISHVDRAVFVFIRG